MTRKFYCSPWVIVPLIFAGILTVWFFWAAFGIRLMTAMVESYDVPVEKAGQVGDLFGGVNALFAAFAFGGVAIAAYYQRRTFLLQHEAGLVQAAQAELARQQFAQQAFEPLFFQLLNRVRRPDQLVLPEEVLNVVGHPGRADAAGFTSDVGRLRRAITSEAGFMAMSRGDVSAAKTIAMNLYLPLYKKNEAVLGPYWRSLYHVFKLIDESALPAEKKVTYASIARATLGVDEIFLLILNCGINEGEGMREFTNRYGLLKHLLRRLDTASVDELLASCLAAPSAMESHEERTARTSEPAS